MTDTRTRTPSSVLAAALAASVALCTAAALASPQAPGSRSAAGSAPATTPVLPAAATAPPVPLLWKVSDADNSLYLLGSFHLLLPGDYPLSRDVDMAFADAEKLVFEMAPEEMASPQLGLQMAQAAMRTDGSTLDQQLGPELAAKLASWGRDNAAQLAATGMTVEVLQRFEPWFVGMMVTISQMMGIGFDPALGLDAHMGGLAHQAQKPATGLETGAQQIAFLDGMDDGEQLQMLEQALDQAEAGADQTLALHAAWRAGDVEAILAGTVAELRRDFPELYRAINVERNDAWLPKLEARLHEDGEDDTLVVVGAMHLLGDDGVVEKLRAKGYAVERVCSACATP
ncbi:TraB/GumN family protein [Luteimonas sp. MC1750]|uniref:TraB/GumN family protein n=1 Tax=Luteimonas sp. MC1750 TaxID=2799326 RepID=UPI0018F068FB|nr:TraB/GumN family protein [Luteimonas sp. MC1750]MBJ6984113.1 TraB/GumN family protein [Luteimonas sp. MC1750]QQO06917.1 TraB/GumN family protein [Luteimonas sp. MC1750]